MPLRVMFGGFVGMMVRDVMMGFTHQRELGLCRVRERESAQEHADQQQAENSWHITSFPRGPSGKDHFIPESRKVNFSFQGGSYR